MESIVSRIIEIDRKANERISDARQKNSEILKSAEEECLRLTAELSAAADKRIREVEDINRTEYEAAVTELEENFSREISEMDSFYEKNHTMIEDEIFAGTVGE